MKIELTGKKEIKIIINDKEYAINESGIIIPHKPVETFNEKSEE